MAAWRFGAGEDPIERKTVALQPESNPTNPIP